MSSLTQTKSVRYTENLLLSFFRTPFTSTTWHSYQLDKSWSRSCKTEITENWNQLFFHNDMLPQNSENAPFFQSNKVYDH